MVLVNIVVSPGLNCFHPLNIDGRPAGTIKLPFRKLNSNLSEVRGRRAKTPTQEISLSRHSHGRIRRLGEKPQTMVVWLPSKNGRPQMNAKRLLLVGAGLLSISALMPPAHGAEGVAQNGRP